MYKLICISSIKEVRNYHTYAKPRVALIGSSGIRTTIHDGLKQRYKSGLITSNPVREDDDLLYDVNGKPRHLVMEPCVMLLNIEKVHTKSMIMFPTIGYWFNRLLVGDNRVLYLFTVSDMLLKHKHEVEDLVNSNPLSSRIIWYSAVTGRPNSADLTIAYSHIHFLVNHKY